VSLPPRLDSYFEEYCDYTGNMGIGFVADHTWDYQFRHRLKTTTDPELKRLFVLQHLYADVEFVNVSVNWIVHWRSSVMCGIPLKLYILYRAT